MFYLARLTLPAFATAFIVAAGVPLRPALAAGADCGIVAPALIATRWNACKESRGRGTFESGSCAYNCTTSSPSRVPTLLTLSLMSIDPAAGSVGESVRKPEYRNFV